MKKQMLVVGATLAVLGGSLAMSAQPVAATKYQPNTDTLESPFVITSVQPSTSTIKVRYNGLPGDNRGLSLINIEGINVEVGATEDQIDENLPYLGQTMPYWNYLIYYEELYTLHPIMDYGPDEKELTESRYQRKIDLDKETLHILYYSVRLGKSSSTDYLYGKIDYSLCMKSAVYKPGVECRAENKEEGGVWYWPYYNGERLEVPKEEWEEWGIKEPEPTPEPTPIPNPGPEVPKVGGTSGVSPIVQLATITPTNIPLTGANEPQAAEQIAVAGAQNSMTNDAQDSSHVWYNWGMSGLYALLAFVLGFVVAQTAKCVIWAVQGRKHHSKTFGELVRYWTRSGGMPSGHSASFVAATTYLGFSQGFTSPIFVLAVCMTIIIIYDAVNVRYAVGEQGKVLAKIIKKEKYNLPQLHIVEGHTVPQIIVGALIGLVIGWLVFILCGNF